MQTHEDHERHGDHEGHEGGCLREPPVRQYPKTGDAVRVRGDRWRVLHVGSYEGCALVELAGTGNTNRAVTARFILPFETAEPVPSPRTEPKRVRPVVARAIARRVLAQATPAWTSLIAAAPARVRLLPFQLEPAIAMTHGLACRFLLADAVGLGKTIQAGVLIAELLARERDARVLIVTPAGLRAQWREELHGRFHIDAEVLDAAALARHAATLPVGVNPWAVPRVALTSIDFIKRSDVIRSLEPLVWDLVAFDEAHGLSGRSDRATAAELLARRARRVVAITATPHSGDSRDYERLCALGRFGPDDPLLVFRRSRSDAGVPSSRVMRLLRITPTHDELALHRALDSYARRVWREAPAESAPAARLAMMVLARRAASSAASLARSIERRLTLLADGSDPSEFQLALPLLDGILHDDAEPDAELGAPGLVDVGAERRWLERIRDLAHVALRRESKIAAIRRLLRRAGEPAIVFTEYRDTLDRLAGVLAPSPEHLPRLHGGLTAAERDREVRRFTRGDACLLLATDAASEGLNLHHRCRLVINLEMPWSPLRLEQRIGRVDRLGQRRRVHAIGLMARDTAEEAVVTALSTRAATAEREAPFAGTNLRAEAEAEAARLHLCRTISPTRAGANSSSRARTDVGACEHLSRATDGRPFVSTLARRRRRIYAAVRLTVVDALGLDLWHTVVGADIPWSIDALADGARKATLAVADSRSPLVQFHQTALRRVREDLGTATRPLIAREKAIRDGLHAHGARLAAPLVQPGLFDRRALRQRDAQARVAADAVATATARIEALRRLLQPAAGERQLIFMVEV
jgi:superfamily II DNA or RNA helicase